jgi:hypothetical protein
MNKIRLWKSTNLSKVGHFQSEWRLALTFSLVGFLAIGLWLVFVFSKLKSLQILPGDPGAYFANIVSEICAAFICGIYLAPLALLIGLWRRRHVESQILLGHRSISSQDRDFIKDANCLHHILAVFTIIPWVSYPLAFLILKRLEYPIHGAILVGIETLVVLITLGIFLDKSHLFYPSRNISNMKFVLSGVLIFCIQFLFTRFGLLVWVWGLVQNGPSIFLFWILFCLFSTWGTLFSSTLLLRRKLRAKALPTEFIQSFHFEALAAMLVLFLVSGLFSVISNYA